MENTLFGYAGKILRVNLSTGKITQQDVTPEFARKYVGGMGFSVKILYDDVGVDVEPYSPENEVIFAVGPLTGTRAPNAGRTEVTTKSALTGIIGSGNMGGMWGARLKFAGFDVVVIEGRSEKPVYLWINDGQVEIKDAAHLWGQDVWAASDAIIKESGFSDVSVTSIGPAGEHLVRYACVITDYHHAAARGSAGGVMGSKNLKAIAVRGTKAPRIAGAEPFQQIVKESRERIKSNPGWERWTKEGSFWGAKAAEEEGWVPGKNFQTGLRPGFAEKLGVPALKKYELKPRGACYSCAMPCFNMVEVKEGKYAGMEVCSATFHSSVMDFQKCHLDSLPAIWKCKNLCHLYGMDYGSAAGSISFAMELFQRGIITKKDTDGMELAWGNEDVVHELLRKIAYREGLGDLLAEGSRKAAQKIGKKTEKYAITIKGLEMMWTDPRAGAKGYIFGYLTNPRGGDNMKSTHDRGDRYNPAWWIDKFDMFDDVRKKIYTMPKEDTHKTWEGKALMTKWFEDVCSAVSALGVCIFPTTAMLAIGPTYLSRLYSACTGFETTPEEMMMLGERVFTLLKAYNVRAGLTRKDDDWPDHFYDDPMPDGPAKGNVMSRETTRQLLDEYYDLRGWDKESGNPSQRKLAALGLEPI